MGVDSVLGTVNTRTGALNHLKTLHQPNKKSEVSYAPGTAFGVTRECFQQLGGFDETFHTYWEDVDLGYRAQLQKIEIRHCDEIKLRHKIGKTCHKDRFYTLYLFQRNRKRFMKKHRLINLLFLLAFSKSMLRLLIRICLGPHPTTPLKLWWRALRD